MNKKGLIPLVDCDILVYRVGFAVKDDEPLEHALSTMRRSVEMILSNFPEAPEFYLYLTVEKGNYRDRVATIQEYKGNRTKPKPKYYHELREYLTQHWNARIIEGREADDAMSCHQWANPDKSTVICSVDKDLRNTPGWHYNFVKGELTYVTLNEANVNFWRQVLTGDVADHIPGIYKVGPKTAEKLIPEGCGSPESIVRSKYIEAYGKEAETRMHEVATLLWIQRVEGINYDGFPISNYLDELTEAASVSPDEEEMNAPIKEGQV